MNIQTEKNDKRTGHRSKGIPVLSEYAKNVESRAKEIYSLWLNDQQPVKI